MTETFAHMHRRPVFIILVMISLVLSAYGIWHAYLSVPFAIVANEQVARANVDRQPDGSHIYLLTSPQAVESVATHILGVDPQQDDQRQRLVVLMRTIDYTRNIALLVFSGQRAGCEHFAIQHIRRAGRTLIVQAFFQRDRGPCPAVELDPAQLVTIERAHLGATPPRFELWNGLERVAIAAPQQP